MIDKKNFKTFQKLKRGDKMWRVDTKLHPYRLTKCIVTGVKVFNDNSMEIYYCGGCSLSCLCPMRLFEGGCNILSIGNKTESNGCFCRCPESFLTTVKDIAITEQKLLLAEFEKSNSTNANSAYESVKNYLALANERMNKLTQPNEK